MLTITIVLTVSSLAAQNSTMQFPEIYYTLDSHTQQESNLVAKVRYQNYRAQDHLRSDGKRMRGMVHKKLEVLEVYKGDLKASYIKTLELDKTKNLENGKEYLILLKLQPSAKTDKFDRQLKDEEIVSILEL
ncbi:MAG: hypothetical protein GY810_06940 [Aureispira sp.]|nr:hypothetical protein [Aureispira sp.]